MRLPPALGADSLASIHQGTPRSEVLMNLGNPTFATADYNYLGYQWFEESFDVLWLWGFYAGVGGDVGAIRRPGILDEHMFMLEFDAGGKVTRMREFSNTATSILRAEIKDWMRTGAKPTR